MKLIAFLLALPLFMAASVFVPIGAPAATVIEDWSAAKVPPPPVLKSVTLDPKKTALLDMDFSSKTCTPQGRPRCAAVLPTIRAFIDKARAAGVMIVDIYSTAMARDDMAIVPGTGDLVMQASLNKFYGNDLATTLKNLGIDTVIITGTSANGAVLFSVGGAAAGGFKVIVPVDGMPADGLYQEQFTAWEIVNAPTVSGASTLTRWDMITL
jgi:nicotinamidase-related amidase